MVGCCVTFALTQNANSRREKDCMTYRQLAAEAIAENDFESFLSDLQTALTDGRRDPNDVVRDALLGIYFPGQHPSQSDQLSVASRAVLHTLDPRNTTTEPEYYTDIDAAKYAERKPFIWLWQMFDRSALGQNALLGHRFRRMLAPLIVRSVGKL